MRKPTDATARYDDFNGSVVWLKDVDRADPYWVLGRLWSDQKRRWKKKREHVYEDRFLPLEDTPA